MSLRTEYIGAEPFMGTRVGGYKVADSEPPPDPWAPADLGAKLFELFDPTGLTLAGSDVASWTGQGAGLVYSEATARPTYDAARCNGKGGVVFNGSNDTLKIEPSPFTAAYLKEVWALVDQTESVGDTAVGWIWSTGNTSGARRGLQRAVDLGVNVLRGIDTNGTERVATAVGDFSGLCVCRIQFTATELIATLNDGTPGTFAMTSTMSSTARTRLGTNPAASLPWGGAINRLIFTDELTTEEADSMWAWAKAELGIA